MKFMKILLLINYQLLKMKSFIITFTDLKHLNLIKIMIIVFQVMETISKIQH
jgi:hypothetical protein